MNKTELIAGLRAHLADKEDIANEAAPALALMRYSLVELEKPTSGGGDGVEVANLRRELASSERAITELMDAVNDREGTLYALLAELMMVPEIDDEPVGSLKEAIEHDPELLDRLQSEVARLFDPTSESDKDRFIDAAQRLLEVPPSEGLQKLWDMLESKAQYLNGLETGIEQRDAILLQADERLKAIRAKLGIPADAHGTFEQIEWPALNLLIEQRQAAQDRLVVGRDEAPDEDTLEAIIEQIITIVGLDWQDVETLPQHIRELHAGVMSGKQQYQELHQLLDDCVSATGIPDMRFHSLANHIRKYVKYADNKRDAIAAGVPLAGWVSDAIDLAHAVRGNLAPENRVMAKAAEAIILGAPGVSDA